MKRRSELLFTAIFFLIILALVACDTPTSQSGGAHVYVNDFKSMGGGTLDLNYGWDIGDRQSFTFTRSWRAICDGETETLESYDVTKDETMSVRDQMQFPERSRAACSATWFEFSWETGSASTDKIDP